MFVVRAHLFVAVLFLVSLLGLTPIAAQEEEFYDVHDVLSSDLNEHIVAVDERQTASVTNLPLVSLTLHQSSERSTVKSQLFPHFCLYYLFLFIFSLPSHCIFLITLYLILILLSL
jgi:hypothetical protein